jgi:hypothetical protein
VDTGFPKSMPQGVAGRAAENAENDVNLPPPPRDPSTGGKAQEARMNHWHDTMVDRPDPNGPAYLTGWTISGLAVIGTIIVVWVLGI